MIHALKIKKVYLDLIKDGVKTYEYRLNTIKRRTIKVNDTLKLINDLDDKDYVLVKVIDIDTFSDFKESLKDTYLNDFKGLYSDLDEVSNICSSYYNEADIKEFDVVRFKIELIK